MTPPRQFDIYRLRNRSVAVVLQDNAFEWLGSRIMAPLVPIAKTKQQPRGLCPVVDFEETPNVLLTQAMSAMLVTELAENIGTIIHLRDEIIRALDLQFTGV
jgi:toxin CcdB